jgi:hypothetical protein
MRDTTLLPTVVKCTNGGTCDRDMCPVRYVDSENTYDVTMMNDDDVCHDVVVLRRTHTPRQQAEAVCVCAVYVYKVCGWLRLSVH